MSNTITLTVDEIWELEEEDKTLDEVHKSVEFSTLIVKHEGKLYRVCSMYNEMEGTRLGDGSDFDIYQKGDSEVELTEVYKTERVTTSYTEDAS